LETKKTKRPKHDSQIRLRSPMPKGGEPFHKLCQFPRGQIVNQQMYQRIDSSKNISNLVRTTRCWDNLHQVRSKPKYLKDK
jgi:hypothetical protein